MLKYVALKVGRALVVIWAAFTVTFVLLYVLPTSPVDYLFDVNELDSLPEEARRQIEQMYGFDQSVPRQYLTHLGHVITGDLGNSVQSGRAVPAAISSQLPPTLLLAVLGLVLALLLACALALTATYFTARWLRSVIEIFPPLFVSVPSFLICLFVIQLFAFRLGWFPAVGDEGPAGYVLPVIALAIPISGPIAQVLLKNFREEFDSPYVTTAYAKGGTRGWIIVNEIFRNASLPALTLSGIIFGYLISGSVIVEQIFSRPGLGQLTLNAISTKDIPLIEGIVLFVALVFALINLVVDLVYPILDPRLRSQIPPTARVRAAREQEALA